MKKLLFLAQNTDLPGINHKHCFCLALTVVVCRCGELAYDQGHLVIIQRCRSSSNFMHRRPGL